MAGEGDFILNVEPHVGEGNLSESISSAEGLIERLRSGQAETNAAGGRFDSAAGFTALRSMLENIIRQAESTGADVDVNGITSRIRGSLNEVTRAIDEAFTAGFTKMAEDVRQAGRFGGGGVGGGEGEHRGGVDVVGLARKESERQNRARTEVLNRQREGSKGEEAFSGHVEPRKGGGATYIYRDPQTGVSRRVGAAEYAQLQSEYGQRLTAPASAGRVTPAPVAAAAKPADTVVAPETRAVSRVAEVLATSERGASVRAEEARRTAQRPFNFPTYTDTASPAGAVNAAAEARGMAARQQAAAKRLIEAVLTPEADESFEKPEETRRRITFARGAARQRRQRVKPETSTYSDLLAQSRKVDWDDPEDRDFEQAVRRIPERPLPLPVGDRRLNARSPQPNRLLSPDQLAIPGLEGISHPFAQAVAAGTERTGLRLHYERIDDEHRLTAYNPLLGEPVKSASGMYFGDSFMGRLRWGSREGASDSAQGWGGGYDVNGGYSKPTQPYPGHVEMVENATGDNRMDYGSGGGGGPRYPGLAGQLFNAGHQFDFGQDTVPIHSPNRTPGGDKFAQQIHPELAPPSDRRNSPFYDASYQDWLPPENIHPFERAQRAIDEGQRQQAIETGWRDKNPGLPLDGGDIGKFSRSRIRSLFQLPEFDERGSTTLGGLSFGLLGRSKRGSLREPFAPLSSQNPNQLAFPGMEADAHPWAVPLSEGLMLHHDGFDGKHTLTAYDPTRGGPIARPYGGTNFDDASRQGFIHWLGEEQGNRTGKYPGHIDYVKNESAEGSGPRHRNLAAYLFEAGHTFDFGQDTVPVHSAMRSASGNDFAERVHPEMGPGPDGQWNPPLGLHPFEIPRRVGATPLPDGGLFDAPRYPEVQVQGAGLLGRIGSRIASPFRRAYAWDQRQGERGSVTLGGGESEDDWASLGSALSGGRNPRYGPANGAGFNDWQRPPDLGPILGPPLPRVPKIEDLGPIYGPPVPKGRKPKQGPVFGPALPDYAETYAYNAAGVLTKHGNQFVSGAEAEAAGLPRTDGVPRASANGGGRKPPTPPTGFPAAQSSSPAEGGGPETSPAYDKVLQAVKDSTALLTELAGSFDYLDEKVKSVAASSDLAAAVFTRLDTAENAFAVRSEAAGKLAGQSHRAKVDVEQDEQLANDPDLVRRLAGGRDARARSNSVIDSERDIDEAGVISGTRQIFTAQVKQKATGSFDETDRDTFAGQRNAQRIHDLQVQGRQIGLTGLDNAGRQQLEQGVKAGQTLFNIGPPGATKGLDLSETTAALKSFRDALSEANRAVRGGGGGLGGGREQAKTLGGRIVQDTYQGMLAGIGGFKGATRVPTELRNAPKLQGLAQGFAGGAGYNALFALQSGIFTSVAAAVALDKQFQLLGAEVQNIGGNSSQFGTLRDTILNVSDATGVAGTDVAQLAQGFLGLYGNVNQVNAALQGAAQNLVVTGQSASEALPQLGAFQSNQGLSPTQAGNAEVTVGLKTGYAPAEIAQAAAAFSGTGKLLGFSPSEVFNAAGAVLKGSGLSGATGGADLSRIAETIPTKLAELSAAGIKFSNPKDRVQDFKDVFQQAPGLSGFNLQEVETLIGGSRNIQATSALINNQSLVANLGTNVTDNDAQATENAAIQKSLGQSFDRLKQSADALGEALVKGAVGQTIGEIVNGGAKLIQVFAEMLKAVSFVNRELDSFPAELIAVAAGLAIVRRVGLAGSTIAQAVKDKGVQLAGTEEEKAQLAKRTAANVNPGLVANTDALVLNTRAIEVLTEKMALGGVGGVEGAAARDAESGLILPSGAARDAQAAKAAETAAAATKAEATVAASTAAKVAPTIVGVAEKDGGEVAAAGLATKLIRGLGGKLGGEEGLASKFGGLKVLGGGLPNAADATGIGKFATGGLVSTLIGGAAVIGGYKLANVGRKGGYGVGDSAAIIGGDTLAGAGLGFTIGSKAGPEGAAIGTAIGATAGLVTGDAEAAYHLFRRPAPTVETGKSDSERVADRKFDQSVVSSRAVDDSGLLSIANKKDAARLIKDQNTINNATGGQDISLAKNDYLEIHSKLLTQAGVKGVSISGRSAVIQAEAYDRANQALTNVSQAAGSSTPYQSIGDVSSAFQSGQITYQQEQAANAIVLANLKTGAIDVPGTALYRQAQAQVAQSNSTEAVNYIASQQTQLTGVQGADPQQAFIALQQEVAYNSGHAVTTTVPTLGVRTVGDGRLATHQVTTQVASQLDPKDLAAEGQSIVTDAAAAVDFNIANTRTLLGGGGSGRFGASLAGTEALSKGADITHLNRTEALALNASDLASHTAPTFSAAQIASGKTDIAYTPAEIQAKGQQVTTNVQAITANKIAILQQAGDSANDLAQKQLDGDNQALALLQNQQDALPAGKKGLLDAQILAAGTAVEQGKVGVQSARLATIKSLAEIQKTEATNNPYLQGVIDQQAAQEEAAALPVAGQTIASIQAKQAAGGTLSDGQIQVLQDNATAQQEKYAAYATESNASLAIVTAGDQFNPVQAAAAQASTTADQIKHYFGSVAQAQAAANDPNNKNNLIAKQILAQNAANPDAAISAQQQVIGAQQTYQQSFEAFNPEASANTGAAFGLKAIDQSYGSIAGAQAAAAGGNTNAYQLLTAYQNDKNTQITAIQAQVAAQTSLTQSTELFDPGKSAKTAVSGQLSAINQAYGSLAAAKAAAAAGNTNASSAVAAYNTAVYNSFQAALADKLGPLQALAATQTAKGDVVGAANTALKEAQIAVARFKQESPQDANLSNATYAGLVGAVATAKGNVLTTTVSFAETQIQELIDTNQLSIAGGINQLKVLEAKALKAGDSSEALAIKDQIQQYINQGNQNAQFNLPSNIHIPTLYEARRTEGTSGGSNYYGNTGTVNVNINIGSNADTQSAINKISAAVGGSSTTGNNLPLY